MSELKLRLLAGRLKSLKFETSDYDGSMERKFASAQTELANKIGDMLLEVLETPLEETLIELRLSK